MNNILQTTAAVIIIGGFLWQMIVGYRIAQPKTKQGTPTIISPTNDTPEQPTEGAGVKKGYDKS